MAKKISITVDDDVYDFIEAVGGDNRSKFITELIRDRQRLELEKELAQQLLEDAADTETVNEGKLWETATILDGLEDWEDDWDDSKAPRNLVG
jgi:hypothetical protein